MRFPKRYIVAGAVLLGNGLALIAAPSALRAQMVSGVTRTVVGPQGVAVGPQGVAIEPQGVAIEPQGDSAENPAADLVASVLRVWWSDPNLDAEPTIRGFAVAARAAESRSLAIPLLASSARQLVLAGKRPFQLAWTGGKPPFKVILLGPDGTPVANWATSQRSVTSTLDLQEGSYEAHVADASGREALGSFEVTGQAPNVDQAVTGRLPDDYRLAILAARLAAVDDGAWQMEAYEQLVAGPGGDATRLTAARLAHGQAVSELLGHQAAVR